MLDSPIDPEELDTAIAKQPASAADPCIEASRMKEAMTVDGFPKLRFWSGSFMWWSQGKYFEVPISEVRAQIVHHLNNGYSRVGTSEVSNTLEQLKAQTILYARVQPPTWLKPMEWDARDVVTTTNSIVHLPSYVADKPNYAIESTPAFFTTCAVDYRFDQSKA